VVLCAAVNSVAPEFEHREVVSGQIHHSNERSEVSSRCLYSLYSLCVIRDLTVTNAGLLTRGVFSAVTDPDRLVVLGWTGLLRATGDTTLFGHHHRSADRHRRALHRLRRLRVARRTMHKRGMDLRSKGLPCTPSTDPSPHGYGPWGSLAATTPRQPLRTHLMGLVRAEHYVTYLMSRTTFITVNATAACSHGAGQNAQIGMARVSICCVTRC
jgi:hypothetical protein